MLIPLPIIKQITMGVIAPHGITDIMHAGQKKKIPQLLQIQVATTAGIEIFQWLHQDKLIYLLFFLSSVAHFRHDMPTISNIPRYVCSAFFLAATIYYSYPDLFLLYMAFIHVPNHYRMSVPFLKKEKVQTTMILVGTTLAFWSAIPIIDSLDMWKNIQIQNIAISIIISHIFYQEKFVHSSPAYENNKPESMKKDK